MPELQVRASQSAVGDRLSLSGTMIVARDIVDANLRQRLAEGGQLPDYFKDHPIYYAGT